MSAIREPLGLLARLRADVVERLAASEDFTDPNPVPVIDSGRSDLLKAISEALIKRSAGLCLSVSIPRVDAGPESTQQIDATVAVQIYERPSTNWSVKGRQTAIEDAAEAVLQSLTFTPDGTGWSPSAIWTRFLFEGFRIVFASTDQVTMEVLFRTSTVVRIAPPISTP